MGRQSQYKIKRDLVIAAINTLTTRNGRSPSLREISAETGVSIATLHSYMGKLQAEGAIEWQEKSHRSIRLKQPGVPVVSSPSPNSPTSPPPAPVPPPSPQPVAAPAAVLVRPDLEEIDPGF